MGYSLCCYLKELQQDLRLISDLVVVFVAAVGRCTLNQVDP
jgi:hypothetical protein